MSEEKGNVKLGHVTEAELDAWIERCSSALGDERKEWALGIAAIAGVPILIAEVRRLRTENAAHVAVASQQLDLHTAAAARAEKAEENSAEAKDCLGRMVRIIESAGISNLSNGVQLGAISWHMKMVNAVSSAKEILGISESAPDRVTEREGGAA